MGALDRLTCAVAIVFTLALGATAVSADEKLPNGGRPEVRSPFPAIANWNSLDIKLRREAGMEAEPEYFVEIRGDGTVLFNGYHDVAAPGKHTNHIPAARIQALYAEFKRADFFWLFDDYSLQGTDQSTYETTISYDGRSKSVVDYSGSEVGMPKAVISLEHAIDVLADTKIWVAGDASTFENLEAEGWDFRATDDSHLSLIESAARGGSPTFVHEILAAGVPATNKFGCHGLSAAALQGNIAVAALLLNAGAPLLGDKDAEHWFGCDALSWAASGGDPEIVRMILARHPNLNRLGAEGSTPLWTAAEWCSHKYNSRRLAETAAILIAAGADVNARDSRGESALMKCPFNAGFVHALLAAGATDVNTPDEDGTTPLMNAFTPAAIETLLRAGADPYLKDKKGRTVLDMDSDDPPLMRLIKQWMAAHPRKPDAS